MTRRALPLLAVLAVGLALGVAPADASTGVVTSATSQGGEVVLQATFTNTECSSLSTYCGWFDEITQQSGGTCAPVVLDTELAGVGQIHDGLIAAPETFAFLPVASGPLLICMYINEPDSNNVFVGAYTYTPPAPPPPVITTPATTTTPTSTTPSSVGKSASYVRAFAIQKGCKIKLYAFAAYTHPITSHTKTFIFGGRFTVTISGQGFHRSYSASNHVAGKGFTTPLLDNGVYTMTATFDGTAAYARSAPAHASVQVTNC